jgi:hypothetical protein
MDEEQRLSMFGRGTISLPLCLRLVKSDVRLTGHTPWRTTLLLARASWHKFRGTTRSASGRVNICVSASEGSHR